MSKKEKKQEKKKSPKKEKKSEKVLYPLKIKTLELKLRVANKTDFIELDTYLEGGKKKWKMVYGLPYWMINVKGEIENQPYVLRETTDKGDFADWLVREQILIPVGRFEK